MQVIAKNIIKQRNSMDFTVKEQHFIMKYQLLCNILAFVHRKLTHLFSMFLLKNRQNWYTIYQAKPKSSQREFINKSVITERK